MEFDFNELETVFDYNLTEDECYGLFGFKDETKESYIKTLKNCYNTKEEYNIAANVSLYLLFSQRGQNEKAMEYANRIPDCDAKWFSLFNCCLH